MILKMQQKQRLFIYDRKEMGILILLAVMVAIFAFTLGVHLGKRVVPKNAVASASVSSSGGAPAPEAATVPDEVPSQQDLSDQHKSAEASADEELDKAAQDEVARTGLKLDLSHQVDLPTGLAKAPKAKEPAVEAPSTGDNVAAISRTAPAGRYTLQVGSYPALQEARAQAEAIEALGLKPHMRAAEIKGKGKWYRVFVGGFASRDAAEKAGAKYRAEHLIESFVVANSVQ